MPDRFPVANRDLPSLVELLYSNIKYQIIKEKDFTVTPDMAGWCKTPITRQSLILKRPRGKRFYSAVRYESGKYSSAI